MDNLVCLWDPITGKRKGSPMKGHNKWITGLSWEPLHLDKECKLLASCSKGK